MADFTGTTLDGKYELNSLLGEGGMGAVYEATHRLIGRKLAVKFLHPQFVTSEEVVTRFQREAQAAAAIGHENIIEVTDMGTAPDGAPYIVMEFLDGQDVRELLAEQGLIAPERAARIMVQALSGLQAAHEVGIIHRDLKPENIFLINKQGQPDYVKLLDFGISKFRSLEAEGAKGLTQTGTVLGTPYYMSPEQARGDQNLSPRSDIYSMGVILYQMLTGRLPFDAPNYNALLIKILTEDPVPPGQLNPDLPADLRETIQVAMARDANVRYATANEFRKKLIKFIPGSSGLGFQTALSAASRTAVQAALSSTSTPTETPLEMAQSAVIKPRGNRLPMIIGGISLAVALAVAGVVVFGLKGSDTKPAPVLPAQSGYQVAPIPQTEEAQKPPLSSEISLKISAEPLSATITIDGTAVKGNPFQGQFPKDGELHKIEITADGYKTESLSVRFNEDQVLRPVLSRERKEESAKLSASKEESNSEKTKSSSRRAKKKERRSSRDTKPNVEPTTSDSIKPARKKPRRKIDDEDPWG